MVCLIKVKVLCFSFVEIESRTKMVGEVLKFCERFEARSHFISRLSMIVRVNGWWLNFCLNFWNMEVSKWPFPPKKSSLNRNNGDFSRAVNVFQNRKRNWYGLRAAGKFFQLDFSELFYNPSRFYRLKSLDLIVLFRFLISLWVISDQFELQNTAML